MIFTDKVITLQDEILTICRNCKDGGSNLSDECTYCDIVFNLRHQLRILLYDNLIANEYKIKHDNYKVENSIHHITFSEIPKVTHKKVKQQIIKKEITLWD